MMERVVRVAAHGMTKLRVATCTTTLVKTINSAGQSNNHPAGHSFFGVSVITRTYATEFLLPFHLPPTVSSCLCCWCRSICSSKGMHQYHTTLIYYLFYFHILYYLVYSLATILLYCIQYIPHHLPSYSNSVSLLYSSPHQTLFHTI